MARAPKVVLPMEVDELLDGPPPADPVLRRERERLLRNRRAKVRRQRDKNDQVHIEVYLPREGLADLLATEQSLSRRACDDDMAAATQLYLLERIAERQRK